MIHNIEPRIFDNMFKKRKAEPKDLFFSFQDDKVLIKEEKDKLWYPSFLDFQSEYPNLMDNSQFLFTIDDINYYLLINNSILPIKGWSYETTKRFRSETKYWRSFAGAMAWQLHRWYSNHKYCSRCGNEIKPSVDERLLYCNSCGFKVYPTISPCVIVAVYDKNRLLLTKYAGREYSNYALIAGFVEIGESLEETVHREVMEEVGVSVKNLKFYKSQPWPFSDTILAGFFAELDGDNKITLQEDELSLGVWIDRDNIPPLESNISLTSEMMEGFRTGIIEI